MILKKSRRNKMLKIPENKTRKKLRITLCVLYLVEIVLCALPYFQYIDEKNVLHSYSVFDIMSVWGLSGSNYADFLHYSDCRIFLLRSWQRTQYEEYRFNHLLSARCAFNYHNGKLYNQPCFCNCTSFVHSYLLSHNAFTDKDATKAPVKQKNTDPNREV